MKMVKGQIGNSGERGSGEFLCYVLLLIINKWVSKYYLKGLNILVHSPIAIPFFLHIFCLSFHNHSPANSFASYLVDSFSLNALNSRGKLKCNIKFFTFINFDTLHIISVCTIHILSVSNVLDHVYSYLEA